MTPHPLTVFLDARLKADDALAEEILRCRNYRAEWHEQSSGVLYTGPGSEPYPLSGLQALGDSRLTRFMASHDPARWCRTAAAVWLVLTAHAEEDGECRGCKPAYGDCYPQWPCDTVLAVAAIWENDPGYQDAITASREPEPPEPRKPEPVTCAGICGKAPVVSETILIQHAGWQRTRFGMMCPTCIADWLEWCEQRQPMY